MMKVYWQGLVYNMQRSYYKWLQDKVFFRIWTESYSYFPVFGKNQRICLNTGKYGYDSVHTRENTDHGKPVFRHFVVIFM